MRGGSTGHGNEETNVGFDLPRRSLSRGPVGKLNFEGCITYYPTRESHQTQRRVTYNLHTTGIHPHTRHSSYTTSKNTKRRKNQISIFQPMNRKKTLRNSTLLLLRRLKKILVDMLNQSVLSWGGWRELGEGGDTGKTPPPAMVALIKVSNSSSPRMASCKCRGVIRFTFKSFAAFPANSRTSAVRYSRMAAQ